MHGQPAFWQEAEQLLRHHYGYAAFREGQTGIIASILERHDTVGIMPTGGGKSVCFQIPALVFGGVTVVVSPLISLMKDQVDTLDGLGIPATFINSTLGVAELRDRMRKAQRGEYRLIYVSPERLDSESFLAFLDALQPVMVAIDEAHCLSQWGHDFRPSYRAIAPLLNKLEQRPIVTAFTATATPEVRQDIIQLLSLREPRVFVTGFDRANLTFSVARGRDKRDFVLAYLGSHQGQSGIIYAATRKEVDALYELLKKKGNAVGRYHAGMSDAERSDSQTRFLYDDIRVMVATNAFGMGIDKSNVRFVLHYNMPRNLEAYYQEAGRAGRDGEPGECVLLYSAQDPQVQKFLIEQSESAPDHKASEYKKLQSMVDYCHTTGCLRTYILRYFGEAADQRCEHCGNCNQDFDIKDITVLAQQIFSCIYRARERFGMTLIAGILRGGKEKRILELGLDRLPTYGLMHGKTTKEIVGYMQTLAADGYLRVTEGQYPVVQLERQAVAVLKQEERVWLKVVRQPAEAQADSALFERLRVLRKELSQREGVPPYVIFSDATLREMSAVCPVDRASLLAVKGVGEVKFDKYGPAFLEILQSYAAS